MKAGSVLLPICFGDQLNGRARAPNEASQPWSFGVSQISAPKEPARKMSYRHRLASITCNGAH